MFGRIAIELFGALLAPPQCAACDAPVGLRSIFCAACASTTEPRARDESVIAPFAYGGAIAVAITRFKYEQRSDLARPLADILRGAVRAEQASLRGIDLVCPVPLHPSRLAERGFNQAALLASPVADDLGARFMPRALARTRDTPRQATLDREARGRNLEEAFEVRRVAVVRGARVLLVDDVRTTGATLGACESALREAGARDVIQLVVACA